MSTSSILVITLLLLSGCGRQSDTANNVESQEPAEFFAAQGVTNYEQVSEEEVAATSGRLTYGLCASPTPPPFCGWAPHIRHAIRFSRALRRCWRPHFRGWGHAPCP